jgi:hypothetical protein
VVRVKPEMKHGTNTNVPPPTTFWPTERRPQPNPAQRADQFPLKQISSQRPLTIVTGPRKIISVTHKKKYSAVTESLRQGRTLNAKTVLRADSSKRGG